MGYELEEAVGSDYTSGWSDATMWMLTSMSVDVHHVASLSADVDDVSVRSTGHIGVGLSNHHHDAVEVE